MNLNRMRPHYATYWAPNLNDGFGQVTFAVGTTIRCRWQDENVLFRGADNKEYTSSAVVYPSEALALRGMLDFGPGILLFDDDGETVLTDDDGTVLEDDAVAFDILDFPDAREIRQVLTSVSLKNTNRIHKALL